MSNLEFWCWIVGCFSVVALAVAACMELQRRRHLLRPMTRRELALHARMLHMDPPRWWETKARIRRRMRDVYESRIRHP